MDTMRLDTLSIEDLDKVITAAQARRASLCDALLAQCRARELAIQEENKQALAKYGIPYVPADPASTAKPPRKRSKEAIYKKGQTYRHPDDAKLVFRAGGSYANWVVALHKQNRRAVLVPEIVTPVPTQKVG